MWEKPYYNVTLLRYLTKQTSLLYLFILSVLECQ